MSAAPIAEPAPERSSYVLAGLLGALAIGSLIPILLVTKLPLNDYANHLARLYAINHLHQEPDLQQFYWLHWQIVPNLATEVLSIPLSSLFPNIYVLGRVIYGLSLLLIASGVVAVQLATSRRLSYVSLLPFLFLYSAWTLVGGLNFMFGIGLGYWGVACYIWARSRTPLVRVLVSAPFAAALFVSHLFGFGVFGLGTLGYEIWVTRTYWRDDRRQLVIDIATFGLPFLAALALLMLSPTADVVNLRIDEVGNGDPMPNTWEFATKVRNLVSFLYIYVRPLDRAFIVIAAAIAIWSIWKRRMHLHPAGAFVLALSLPLYFAMPQSLFGSWGADLRLPITILFLVLGFIDWSFKTERERYWFAGVVVVLFVTRVTPVASTWASFEPFWSDLSASFEQIDRGSKILVAQYDRPDLGPQNTNKLIYAACLAIIERASFVSNTFAFPPHHVLNVTSPNLDSAILEGNPAPIDRVLQASPATHAYYADWQRKFDFLYVLWPPDGKVVDDPQLALVYQSPYFQLYAIKSGNPPRR
jgi:hypothetical protein